MLEHFALRKGKRLRGRKKHVLEIPGEISRNTTPQFEEKGERSREEKNRGILVKKS